jgi:acetyltransferase-like isoleucine patch superfamily enzyme
VKRIISKVVSVIIVSWYKLIGPPRRLIFSSQINARILRAFGAQIGENNLIYPPIVLHHARKGFSNLIIEDNCILNGNNFLDLSGRITFESGASIGPGVTIMTHNAYNFNPYLTERLPHTVGFKDVVVRRGANVKAHALIVMGVTVGEDSVIAGGAVVNVDVPDRHLVSGVPARVVTEII